ncbi:MAG: nucleoside phosphorylase [Prolixibacteraceae bacterium]
MIGSSELVINPDGSVFHLHLKPEQIADYVILVGDPGRVDVVAEHFDTKEPKIQNREFASVTGTCGGQPMTVISTGIGTDNIDIVMNELDALVNIDFKTREISETRRSLNIIRIGTSGGIRDDLNLNDFVISRKAIGFDGLLNFYAGRENITDSDFEQQFKNHLDWNPILASPYVVDCSASLLEKILTTKFSTGVTISAPGFYGPQGRVLRLDILDPDINEKIKSFSYNDYKITNYEMECSAIYGLSALMGHEALTVCLIITDRLNKKANIDYHQKMESLIRLVLKRVTT